jgi:hypothetical protein
MNLYTLKTKRNSCNEISKIYAPLNKEEKEKIYIYINDGLNYILKDYQIKENKKKKKKMGIITLFHSSLVLSKKIL